MPTVAIQLQLLSILCQTGLSPPSFVIFDIRALWRSDLSVSAPWYSCMLVVDGQIMMYCSTRVSANVSQCQCWVSLRHDQGEYTTTTTTVLAASDWCVVGSGLQVVLLVWPSYTSIYWMSSSRDRSTRLCLACKNSLLFIHSEALHGHSYLREPLVFIVELFNKHKIKLSTCV